DRTPHDRRGSATGPTGVRGGTEPRGRHVGEVERPRPSGDPSRARRATTRRADEGTRREANGFGVSGRTAGGESPILGHSDAGTRSPGSEPARRSGGPRRGAGRLRGRSTRIS